MSICCYSLSGFFSKSGAPLCAFLSVSLFHPTWRVPIFPFWVTKHRQELTCRRRRCKRHPRRHRDESLSHVLCKVRKGKVPAKNASMCPKIVRDRLIHPRFCSFGFPFKLAWNVLSEKHAHKVTHLLGCSSNYAISIGRCRSGTQNVRDPVVNEPFLRYHPLFLWVPC